MNRRGFLMGSTVAGTVALAGAPGLAHAAGQSGSTRPSRSRRLDLDIEDLQQKTFQWFVDVTDRRTGLTPDRWPTPSFCSIAAVGFALTCWPIGVERGWMRRDEARERTLTTLRFFHDLPQGPEATGVSGYKGFFYHFLDMETGHRFAQCELSTIDTTLLLGGVLFAGQWFDGRHADEVEIRRLAQALYERVEWDWSVIRHDRISMGWHPESGFIASDWYIYNEAMLALHLAMGSPTHPVATTVWDEWCSAYLDSWTDRWGGIPFLHYPAAFVHQYSHMYTDYRGIKDAWMRGKSGELGQDVDYFQNTVRAIHAQREYAIENPGKFVGYGPDIWGFTACDGPGDFKQTIDGVEREFFSYSVRGPGDRDDGTIAPTAAAASIVFAPDLVIPAVKAMKTQYGAGIYTKYGFLDSFNPTLSELGHPLQHGKIVPGVGWVDGDYLGIDQGPIVIMIENYRSGIVWNHMRTEPNVLRGLRRAGFTGGWLDTVA